MQFLRRNRRLYGILSRSMLSDTLPNLPYKKLPHHSVQIEATSFAVDDVTYFETCLNTAVESFHQHKIGTVYVNVPMTYGHFIPAAKRCGFQFHRAEGECAVLFRWLPDTECKVPPFATHHCGVGAVALHDGNILLVREKGRYDQWKLPGGLMDLGEDVGVAVAREVWEETGITAEFRSVIAIRHSHNIQFGRSDLYWICRVEPLSTKIIVDDEIADATWMPFEEFKQQNKSPLNTCIIEAMERNPTTIIEKTVPSVIEGRPPFKLYIV